MLSNCGVELELLQSVRSNRLRLISPQFFCFRFLRKNSFEPQSSINISRHGKNGIKNMIIWLFPVKEGTTGIFLLITAEKWASLIESLFSLTLMIMTHRGKHSQRTFLNRHVCKGQRLSAAIDPMTESVNPNVGSQTQLWNLKEDLHPSWAVRVWAELLALCKPLGEKIQHYCPCRDLISVNKFSRTVPVDLQSAQRRVRIHLCQSYTTQGLNPELIYSKFQKKIL